MNNMRDMGDTYFDEATDGKSYIPSGTYPAHAVTLEMKDQRKDGTSFKGGSKVFNVTFQIADEVSELKIPKVIKQGGEYVDVKDDDGNTVTIDGSFLKGKKFSSIGLWVRPNPEEGKGWMNRNYLEFFSNMGVEFPDVEGKTKLMEVEESDIVGLPALIKIDNEEYEFDGETRTAVKIFAAYPWSSGVRLDPSELDSDIPF
jgi:hypothetical protein